MADYRKPLPRPSAVSMPFWQAAKRHELQIQRCGSCGAYVFYPREVCAECLSSNLSWVKVSGSQPRGSLPIPPTSGDANGAGSQRSVADLGTIRAGVTSLLPRGPMESDCSGTATHGIRVALPVPERFSAGIHCGCRDSRRAGRPRTLRTLTPVSIAGGAYWQFA